MSTLVIPIDASQILPEKERGAQRIRVAIRERDGVKSKVIPITAAKTEVKLEVDAKQVLDIAVGPENASDEDIFHLQTPTARVVPRLWGEERVLTIPPIVLTLWWWRFWLRWCRDFVVDGRVVCSDGSPVPGALVRAFDVDHFWWWASISQVGPAVITDANGHFVIKFRWCCGWWPWWWWRLRSWRLEHALAERIHPVLKLNPNLRFREPDPVPCLNFLGAGSEAKPLPVADPGVIPTLREKLLSTLPRVPELERLHVWPWWPWTPWFDCTPDLIFRVTQDCGGMAGNKVIVNENIFDVRWDIPTHLDVTLLANKDACCLNHGTPDPEGDCALYTGVCGDPGILVTDIGGNSAHPAGPDGYASPGVRDRPFSEVVHQMGQFGTSAQADFYEIEYRAHTTEPPPNPNPWVPVPGGALLDLLRGYFDATKPWPNQWFYVPFPVKTFGMKHVYESRHHYEDANAPPNWGSPMGRSWFMNMNLVASIQTAGYFPDDAYDFRIIGYKALPNGDLNPATRTVLPGCGGHPQNNMLVLRIDNRIVGAPTPGSVHVNTSEPDCGITSVKLGGILVAPCGSEKLQPGTPLDVEFSATDPDGHLDHYELVVKYDLGLYKDLLLMAKSPAGSLTSIPANQQGPDYSNAVNAAVFDPALPAQTAVRPHWYGGKMHLRINDAATVFPKTCCYVIELRCWKRNIVNCHGPASADDLSYYNEMHYSFTVIV